MNYFKKIWLRFETLEWIVIVSLILLAVVILLGGCSGARPVNTTSSTGTSPAEIVKVVRSVSIYPFFAVAGVTGAVFVSLLGMPKIGVALGIACTVGLVLSLAVVKYSGFLAISGLVGVLAAGVAVVYLNRKTLFQLVTGVQKLRTSTERMDKPIVDKMLDINQDKDTQKVVQKVKKTLKRKGVI